MGNLVRIKNFETKKDIENKKMELEKEKVDKYNSKIKKYREYCIQTSQEENIKSVLDFCMLPLKKRVKKTTWEKSYSH